MSVTYRVLKYEGGTFDTGMHLESRFLQKGHDRKLVRHCEYGENLYAEEIYCGPVAPLTHVAGLDVLLEKHNAIARERDKLKEELRDRILHGTCIKQHLTGAWLAEFNENKGLAKEAKRLYAENNKLKAELAASKAREFVPGRVYKGYVEYPLYKEYRGTWNPTPTATKASVEALKEQVKSLNNATRKLEEQLEDAGAYSIRVHHWIKDWTEFTFKARGLWWPE